MKISINILLEKCIWLLSVFLFMTFLVFDTYSWGRYAFFGASVLLFLMSAFSNGGRISIRLSPYYGFFILFAMYVAVTSTWAWDRNAAISKASTLVQILGCSALVFVHYDRQDNVRSLLNAIKWAGFIVSIYAIFYYGFDNLGLEEGDRIGNKFANINGIGMAAALACILQVYELLYKRSRWSAVMMVPAVIMIAATQSRTALVMLLTGCIGVCLVRAWNGKSISKRMIKTILLTAGVIAVFYLVLKLPIFNGLMRRMEALFASWTGEGKADHSAVLRRQMIQLGWDTFLEHPIGGIGMGSSAVLIERNMGYINSYLHNNFVELLASGGIFAFLIYYSMHIYLLISMIKYRKADAEMFVIGIVWLVITLGMHYGTVAYYTKLDWYYLMTLFLLVGGLKKKGKVQKNEYQKIG